MRKFGPNAALASPPPKMALAPKPAPQIEGDIEGRKAMDVRREVEDVESVQTDLVSDDSFDSDWGIYV